MLLLGFFCNSVREWITSHRSKASHWRRREADQSARFNLEPVTSVSAAFLTDRNLANQIVSVIKNGLLGNVRSWRNADIRQKAEVS